jgi:glycerol kinase
MDVIHTMEQDSGTTMTQLRVDGGAAINDLLMQIQANVLGKDVVRPAVTETTALGAAYLAGLGTGFWKNINEIKDQWQEDKTFRPVSQENEINKMVSNWRKALDRSKNWNRTDQD